MANVLSELFRRTAEAIREKTGESGTMKPAEFPEKIRGITAGAGEILNGAEVHTVTFIGADGSVLHEKSVIDCDDSYDPVTTGKIGTPVKENTAQYEYTFNGWSLTDGGTASNTAIDGITEDRTVYASFVESVRYYTISYYDGDTLLKTESVVYGTVPSYKPTKSGYEFVKWNPSGAITGNTTCTAVWKELPAFATATWAEIAEIAESGEAANNFNLGDTRTETVMGEEITFEIAGFNHDDLSDGSGKAGITIIAKTTLTPHVMHSTASMYSYTYWETSDLRKYLNDTVYPSLSEDFKAVIKEVVKVSDKNAEQTLNTLNEKIWIPSFEELTANSSVLSESNYTAGQGTCYERYRTNIEAQNQINRYRTKQDGTKATCWLRSVSVSGGIDQYGGGSQNFIVLNIYGKFGTSRQKDECDIALGFCI